MLSSKRLLVERRGSIRFDSWWFPQHKHMASLRDEALCVSPEGIGFGP